MMSHLNSPLKDEIGNNAWCLTLILPLKDEIGKNAWCLTLILLPKMRLATMRDVSP